MIEATRVGAILLAAGQSQRFGVSDKLAHEWRGKPLVRHAADTLSALPFAAYVAVVGTDSASELPAQFDLAANPEPENGLSHSIALGVSALGGRDLDACLIALADMPLVPQEHFTTLLDAFAPDGDGIVATISGSRAQVPAVFARAHFSTLTALSGDHGARDLLSRAAGISCDPTLLVDFDRPEDFEI